MRNAVRAISSLHVTLMFCLLVLSVVVVQFVFPQKGSTLSNVYLADSVESSIIKLRLDMKEYMIVQDEKYLLDFDKEVRQLFMSFELLRNDNRLNETLQQSVNSLIADLKTYEEIFKKIVVLERENSNIERTVFTKYNAILEEQPNKILFQSFDDNDPMSGNSSAYLLDSLLKYKLSVASYILNNNEFFLIRSKELRSEIDKHAGKIELVVENKESLKRIKIFKEAFTLYAEGFDTLSKNTQLKRVLLTQCFDDLMPKMIEDSEQLRLGKGNVGMVENAWSEKFSLVIFSALSFLLGMMVMFVLRKKESGIVSSN